MSEEQHTLQEELVKRYERLRSEKLDPREDNALTITTDGRKLATDARMLSATAPDFPESKINRLVENVADKALKAANTIETTPQRVQSKQATAEEPITARIRKRQEANSVSGHPVRGDVSPEPSVLQSPPAAGDDSSTGQPMTFQKRIAMERKRQDREPSLP